MRGLPLPRHQIRNAQADCPTNVFDFAASVALDEHPAIIAFGNAQARLSIIVGRAAGRIAAAGWLNVFQL